MQCYEDLSRFSALALSITRLDLGWGRESRGSEITWKELKMIEANCKGCSKKILRVSSVFQPVCQNRRIKKCKENNTVKNSMEL